jgi:cell division protein ZapE
MADVHERIFVYRQRVKRGEVKDADPIPVVATQLAQEAPFLCFDEFMVRDIADAMILGRLFTHLFAQGVIVVATSNVEPSRLYEGGLNRALFLPFLELMKQHMDVVRLDARTDFRMEKLGSEPVYIVADSKEAAKALTQLFKKMTGHAQAPSFIMTVKGRELVIPQAKDGVARLSFNELCRQPLGAGDYLAISQRFHTVMIDDIPIMGEEERNEAKRFMTLIDALYDNHVKVIATARAEPAQLYTATYGAETFEFARTVSRLMEMRSKDYLARPHGRQDSQASDDITGLVET